MEDKEYWSKDLKMDYSKLMEYILMF